MWHAKSWIVVFLSLFTHFFHSNDSSNMPFTPSPINLKVAVPMKGHAAERRELPRSREAGGCPTETSGRRPRRKRWEGPKRTKVSGVLSAAITALLYNLYLHQRSSQSKYSRCQNRAFCGWRIQWHSSGNMISLDGTPII